MKGEFPTVDGGEYVKIFKETEQQQIFLRVLCLLVGLANLTVMIQSFGSWMTE
jgi:hypothetical protein